MISIERVRRPILMAMISSNGPLCVNMRKLDPNELERDGYANEVRRRGGFASSSTETTIGSSSTLSSSNVNWL